MQPVAQAAELLADWPDCRLPRGRHPGAGQTALHFDGVEHYEPCPAQNLRLKRQRHSLQAAQHPHGAAHPRRREHPSTAAHPPSLGLAAAAEAAIAPALNQQPERTEIIARHNARLRQALAALPEGAHQQPGKRRTAHSEPELQGCAARPSSRHWPPKGVCIGQVRLFGRRYAFRAVLAER